MARPLRVAIDLRPLALESIGGIGLLLSQVLEELSLREISFVGVTDRPLPAGRLPAGVKSWTVSAGGGRIRWEALALPGFLRGLEPAPDLFHATWNHGVPRGLLFPSLLSLHDLIPWRAPHLVPWPRPAFLHQALYRRAVRASARSASLIVTLSETSRRDIEQAIPEVRTNVIVVPCAVPRWFVPPPPEAASELCARFGGPYWLYLGGFDPRKGVETLIEAIAILRARGMAPPPVVLAGALNAQGRALRAKAASVDAVIHCPGYVADAELPRLYAGASLFVYPSRAEGFGIPPLLAMAAGTPVIAADGGAVPEVLGDAGWIVPAGDAVALAAALERMTQDPTLGSAMRAKGRARAAVFSVDALAERMIQAYERAARPPAKST